MRDSVTCTWQVCCTNSLCADISLSHLRDSQMSALRFDGALRVPQAVCTSLWSVCLAHARSQPRFCRRATVNTFGYIAKAIGPQDVLVTLLNNLKVGLGGRLRRCAHSLFRLRPGSSFHQDSEIPPASAPARGPDNVAPQVQERQNRVCTTVAIAIVAETCAPFTVLPALMNEYKASPLPRLHTARRGLQILAVAC